MVTECSPVEQHPGHTWYAHGHSAFSGALLALFQKLDGLFLRWAAESQARDYLFPPCLPAAALDRVDYFRSFPHLVTFPVALSAQDANLKQFSATAHVDASGSVPLTSGAPVRDVLTPAACYHFYWNFAGEELDQPRYVTTRATCFRRETQFIPLQRQWSFTMREIVCLGTAEEVQDFLGHSQQRIDRFLQTIGLPVSWQAATDAFFDPSSNAKYLLQKLAPNKTEMVFQEHLAIGSINFHRNYFGEAFGIRRHGQAAYSGCVAFGLERWIYAWLTQFGRHEQEWPDLG